MKEIAQVNDLKQLAGVKKDMAEVRSGMMEVFRGVRSGSIDRKDADAIANAAGKIIGAAKAELASIALAKAIQDSSLVITPALPD